MLDKIKKFLLKDNRFIYIGIFVFAFLVMTLVSKSSFLYRFNDWVDANAYFTMGKGLFNGKVLYADLFDHKGPLIYLIYGIGYLISNTTFIGVFILEVLAFFMTLSFAFKIGKLYLSEKYSLILVAVFTFLLCGSKFLQQGGSPEEFCLPFILMGIYYLIKNISLEKKKILNSKKKDMYLIGLSVGAILLIKLNLVLVFVPFVISYYLKVLMTMNGKKFWIDVIFMFLGFMTFMLPFIIYILVTNSFQSFMEAYIFFNETYAGFNGIVTGVKNSIASLLVIGLQSLNCFLILVGGLILFLMNKKVSNLWVKISTLASIILTFGMIYLTGRLYPYLIIPVLAFLVFSLIGFLNLINKKLSDKKIKYSYLIVISLFLLLPITVKNENIYESRFFEVTDPAQIEFAKIINEDEDPTLLNFLSLDAGFYTAANIIPNIKYFYIPNIEFDLYPEVYVKQYDALEDKLVKYVVVTNYNEEAKSAYLKLNDHYEEITRIDNYVLFKLVEE